MGMVKRWAAMGAAAAISLAAACPAVAAKSSAETEKALTDTMEKQMLEFVRNNYPGRMNTAIRSMQNQESRLRKTLVEAAQFLEGFAIGPVRLEGRWEDTGHGLKFMLLSVVQGVQHYPKATVTFRTYPGFFRPFTVVQVDADGDGKVDEQSTALCKRERMLEWLSKRFPQAACIARRK